MQTVEYQSNYILAPDGTFINTAGGGSGASGEKGGDQKVNYLRVADKNGNITTVILGNAEDDAEEIYHENQDPDPKPFPLVWLTNALNYIKNVGTAAKMTAGWTLGIGADKRTFDNDRVADAMRSFLWCKVSSKQNYSAQMSLR